MKFIDRIRAIWSLPARLDKLAQFVDFDRLAQDERLAFLGDYFLKSERFHHGLTHTFSVEDMFNRLKAHKKFAEFLDTRRGFPYENPPVSEVPPDMTAETYPSKADIEAKYLISAPGTR